MFVCACVCVCMHACVCVSPCVVGWVYVYARCLHHFQALGLDTTAVNIPQVKRIYSFSQVPPKMWGLLVSQLLVSLSMSQIVLEGLLFLQKECLTWLSYCAELETSALHGQLHSALSLAFLDGGGGGGCLQTVVVLWNFIVEAAISLL